MKLVMDSCHAFEILRTSSRPENSVAAELLAFLTVLCENVLWYMVFPTRHRQSPNSSLRYTRLQPATTLSVDRADLGEDVVVHGVSEVVGQVLVGPLAGGKRLADAAQPRPHRQSAVLKLLDLKLLQVVLVGKAQRVKAASRVRDALRELREGVRHLLVIAEGLRARAVQLSQTHQQELQAKHVAKVVRVARRLGRRVDACDG
mmetsp:Transcript_9021/g.27977  ORF Transcript_9021/g.27977 Transcript_9021/m.27977 type:complete len:203 (-) Transcript_9021:393-1001(-)